jgi:leucyl aminopeptidase (aminopeptidase T)
VLHALYKDVPDKYLDLEPRYYVDWLKHTNVYIGLPGVEDPKAFIKDIPQERLARAGKATHFFGDVINSLPVREVDVNYPRKADADIAGMNLEDYQKLMFAGINTDYEVLSAHGKKIRAILRSGKQVRVTTPAGTDLTFSMAPERGVYLDDGMVTEEEGKAKTFTERYVALPGGSIYFAPLETSVNGKVVVPRASCRYQPVDKATFDVKDGKIISFKANSNQTCYDEISKNNTGQSDMFGAVWIGLNPRLHVVEDDKANFQHVNIAGMVSIGFGDNRQYGGSLDSVGGSNYHLTNATVTVDGKTVVKDGKLVL